MRDQLNNYVAFEGRSTHVNYDHIADLVYLGSYVRRIPVSLNRMIENAYDWEHLPFVHSSTFHDITLIDQGEWGWRAELSSAKSNGRDKSLLELLVDAKNHYWATTVVSGTGKGVEIHTQATEVAERKIEVEVRFYLPKRVNWLRKKLSYMYLKRQYRNLYDEDAALMHDRQSAIDDRLRWRDQASSRETRLLVGNITELDRNITQVIEAPSGRYCVVFNNGQWNAYSAVCPHQLGKLDKAIIEGQGIVTCPWHGYRFDIRSGENIDNKCIHLPVFTTDIAGEELFIITD